MFLPIGIVVAESLNAKTGLHPLQNIAHFARFFDASSGRQARGEESRTRGMLRVLRKGSASPGDRSVVVPRGILGQSKHAVGKKEIRVERRKAQRLHRPTARFRRVSDIAERGAAARPGEGGIWARTQRTVEKIEGGIEIMEQQGP